MKRILLIRLDKIGDLVSTLPVDEVLQRPSFQSEISPHLSEKAEIATPLWVISKGMGFIAEHSVPPREYVELDKNETSASITKLTQVIRTFRPELAVSFQAPWWVHWVLWKEKVPLRAGVRSQWHSFLFLNKSLRQKRSQSLKHEADYNWELLNFALDRSPQEGAPVLKLMASDLTARTLLPQYNLFKYKYIVIHPGMAGSARNWPLTHYHDLIEWILKEPRFTEHKIVITGTSMDRHWTEPLAFAFAQTARCVFLHNKLSAAELLVILKNASTLVAPSTGVLHLGASLGTRCVGLFSPLLVQRPRRWRARSPHTIASDAAAANPETLVSCLEPAVSCPEARTCLEQDCPSFDCMSRITVAQVINNIC